MLTPNQREAVRYWEVRRLILNGLMAASANLGWGIANRFNVGIDELPGAHFSDPGIAADFCWIFVVLNLAFSVGYAAEYFFQSEPKRFWPRPARTILLCVLSLLLIALAAKAGTRLAYHTSIEKAFYTPQR